MEGELICNTMNQAMIFTERCTGVAIGALLITALIQAESRACKSHSVSSLAITHVDQERKTTRERDRIGLFGRLKCRNTVELWSGIQGVDLISQRHSPKRAYLWCYLFY